MSEWASPQMKAHSPWKVPCSVMVRSKSLIRPGMASRLYRKRGMKKPC
jgi:hypothetical protein